MIWFALVLLALLLPFTAAAQVAINEIAWMGVPVEGVDTRQHWRYEFVEIFNGTENSIALDGWQLELSRSSSAEASAGKESVDFRVALSGRIEAGDYFVVGASDKIPNTDFSYANLSGKFVNSGQRVVLRDSSGAGVEEIDARQGWFAGDNDSKLSMERWDTATSANESDNWFSSLEVGGTPGKENSVTGKTREQLLESVAEGVVDLAFLQKNQLGAGTSLVNEVTITAAITALLSVLLVVTLRQYLRVSARRSSGFEIVETNEDSSDALLR